MRKNEKKKGFTLIELLIVIGIIGFLAAAILVAVDPVKRIQDSRNSQRWSEVKAILSGILKKQVDDRALYNGETTAPIITDATNVQVIVADDTGIVCNAAATRPGCDQSMDIATADDDCVADLSGLVPTYLAELPTDPNAPATAVCSAGCTTLGDIVIGDTNSGYYIHRTTGNRIEIGACQPEQSATIRVKR
ncbi:MAG: prepilin-type N-terminal cleavage/methylation domain-containing protein [Patescibacteria group bacterium]|nr:prepilin-type N-terminal cleavage/methylation domain-containing protein [Patescibacteria group bacterium]